MHTFGLPDSLTRLVNNLELVSSVWHGVPVQLPKFAVYAIIDNPVFARYFYHRGRKMGQLNFGRYRIPVMDPFKGDLDSAPNHVLIITHVRDNRFGLYGLPADAINESISIPVYHHSVKRLVKDFV